jgi:60S ribosome subunit biogenesis protein NIP7
VVPGPQETKMVFEKLFKFVGKNLKSLIDRQDEPYCFRMHKNRVYYVKERIMKKATNVGPCLLAYPDAGD